jgi:diguanylate cyclase (GGDEF)-like protein
MGDTVQTPVPADRSSAVAAAQTARARTVAILRLGEGSLAHVGSSYAPHVLGIGVLLAAIGAVLWVITGGPGDDPAWTITTPLIVVGAACVGGGIAVRMVSDRARVLARDEELQAHLDAVLAIGEQLTRTFDREAILRTIVDETNRVLRADTTTLRVVHGDGLVLAASAGPGGAERQPPWRTEGDAAWLESLVAASRPIVRDRDGASELAVPLLGSERVLGALTAVARAPREWSGGDLEFISALAGYASIALHNAELFEATHQRAAHLQVVQAASARMSRQNTVESVGRAIVEETGRIIDYHNARVYVLEPPDVLVPIAFEGRVGEYEKVDLDLLRCRLGEGFTGWAGQRGLPLLVNDANRDPRGKTIPGTDDVDESMLVVPMRFEEQVVGVVTLSKLGIGQFSEDDLRLLSILADQAAIALESARNLATSQSLAVELRRLLDMSSELSQSLDPHAVADLIARHLVGALGADECTISYFDRVREELLTLASEPARPEEQGAIYRLADYPETQRALRWQQPVSISVTDPRADRAEVELLRRQGMQAVVMLPLVAKGQTVGLVELMTRSEAGLDASRLELAQTMANEAAMALENAWLYEDARKRADRDQLTGFFNHRFFYERLGEEIVRAGRTRQPLSVLMIDLDNFKLINDTFGHLFGDRVLVWTAELITATLRASDVPARYGGDEFAVILPETGRDGAARVIERIEAAFREHAFHSTERGPVPVGVSIGVATHPDDGRTSQDLVAMADAGLYRVKGLATRGSPLERSPAPTRATAAG